MFVRSEFKKFLNPNDSYLIGISGRTRVGKSSFVTEILQYDYKYNRKERLQGVFREISELNRLGHNLQPPPVDQQHLIFSADRVLLGNVKRDTAVRTYDLPVERFGLPNPDFDVYDVPYGSVVWLDEIHSKMNARDWKNFSMWVYGFFQFHGHKNITVILTAQNLMRIDVSVRELLHRVIYITAREVQRKYFFFTKFSWHTLIYTGTTDVIGMGCFGKIPENIDFYQKNGYIVSQKFSTYDNPHNRYDSRAGRVHFRHENMRYDYLLHRVTPVYCSELSEYKKNHGYSMNERSKKEKGQKVGCFYGN